MIENAFSTPFLELAGIAEIKNNIAKNKTPFLVSGNTTSQKVHLMYELGKEYQFNVVVTSDTIHAKEIYEDFLTFNENTYLYTAKDLLFYQADLQGNLLVKSRLEVLKHICENEKLVIVTTIDAFMNQIMPKEEWFSNVINIEKGQKLILQEFAETLNRLGYERVGIIDTAGQFCLRGGIIDIFPLTDELPYRIELWDDEIDSIRTFDIESQRSIDMIEEIKIYPASELVFDKKTQNLAICNIKADTKKQCEKLKKTGNIEAAFRLQKITEEVTEMLEEGLISKVSDSYAGYFINEECSFIDYFNEDNTIVFIDEPNYLEEKGKVIELEFKESMINRLEAGYVLPKQTKLFFDIKDTIGKLYSKKSVIISGLNKKVPLIKDIDKYDMTVKSLNLYHNSFEMLIKDLKNWKKQEYKVLLLSPSKTRTIRLANDLREYGLDAFCSEDKNAVCQSGQILVMQGALHRGFEYPLIKLVVITEGDMFKKAKKAKKHKKIPNSRRIKSFDELSIGDYVVHENYGVGIYRGIENVDVEGIEKDYIKLEYADKGKLYIAATQLEVIQKYASSESHKPKLNKLGGSEWHRTKTRVKSVVNEIAKELVELYADRAREKGFIYEKDTIWQKEFEEMFPYEETTDQIDAIEAVKADMQSDKIMERLICGDVGYGKTEIAIRAAFKAVQENKQVVYLVPTTILAQQHYNTFVQRMKDFPVRIDLMSRFRTKTEQKLTIEALKKGQVDIVIGTHRVLSKDMMFKDLGLLVIDEEQRFGVTHKEKIKQMKTKVDVLTLTATPIPRTLHMSLIGIRDMSVLEEAPEERLPIQTYVMEYNYEVIREAIKRELARNGQVYYVYNRVKNIDEITNKIAALVPEANVSFAHGQMGERELEKRMLGFINGEIDVLVSTTIIETGLDISNANTMIIHDSDRLGLSQLYQLRGRIGRSNQTSYAFLMYKKDKLLREEAEKRLQAIREFTALGSGIKIAMRDLEIRGAGNLLGERQHGHMEAVGYDLYCKMLNQAVSLLKGEDVKEQIETTVDIDINAYIPNEYIKNDIQKLDVYKKISDIENREEYEDMQDELIDCFGDIPASVENLLKITEIKFLARSAHVISVKANRQECILQMYENAAIDVGKIPDLVKQYNKKLEFRAYGTPEFIFQEKKQYKNPEEILKDIKILLNNINMLIVS